VSGCWKQTWSWSEIASQSWRIAWPSGPYAARKRESSTILQVLKRWSESPHGTPTTLERLGRATHTIRIRPDIDRGRRVATPGRKLVARLASTPGVSIFFYPKSLNVGRFFLVVSSTLLLELPHLSQTEPADCQFFFLNPNAFL